MKNNETSSWFPIPNSLLHIMSNKGGRSKKHCLVGFVRPKSTMGKRANKQKANARKADAVQEFQQLTAGV